MARTQSALPNLLLLLKYCLSRHPRGEDIDTVWYHSQDSLFMIRVHIYLRLDVWSIIERLHLFQITRVEPLREPPVNLVDVDIEEFPVVGIRIETLLLLDLTSFGINCRTEPSG